MRFLQAPLLLAATVCLLAGCTKKPVAPQDLGDDLYPQWSTSGQIAFLHIDHSGQTVASGLYVWDAVTGLTRSIYPAITNGFDWVPGTDTLIVSAGGTIFEISEGAAPRGLIAHEAFNCDVSPDGKLVAFDASAGRRTGAFLLDRVALQVGLITPDTMLYQFPSWDPAGSQLVVLGGAPSTSGVFLMLPSGAPRKQLLASRSGLQSPALSSRGGLVAWVEFNGVASQALVIADTSGTRVLSVPNCAGGGSWSPDGRLFAFSRQTAVGARLYTVEVPTGRVRPLL